MEKVRRLASTILSLLVFVCLPSISHALVLGDIRLHSHLNEPLDAEIPLYDLSGIELSEIIPKIASQELYDKAGYDLPQWITTIRFSLDTDPATNQTYLRLSTPDPIKDPFGDLLIEAVWPTGRLVREYTLLFDPPKGTSGSVPIKDIPNSKITLSVPPLIAPKAQISTTQKNQAAPSKNVTWGGNYGPVTNETLWSIAKKLVQNSAFTVYQGVDAIAAKNPQAFRGGNIHKMIDGSILALPTQDELQKYTASHGQHIVEQHGKGATNEQPLVANDMPSKPLKLVTSEVPSIQGHSSEEVKINAGIEQVLPASYVQQQLSLIEEAIDTLKRTNEDINHQNQSLSSLLAMKDDEIKKLKGTLHANHDENEIFAKEGYAIAVPDHENPNEKLVHTTKTSTVKHQQSVSPAQLVEPEPIARPVRSGFHLARQIMLLAFAFIIAAIVFLIAWFGRDRIPGLLTTFIATLRNISLEDLRIGKWVKKNVKTSGDTWVEQTPYHASQVDIQFDLDKAISAVSIEQQRYKHPTSVLPTEENKPDDNQTEDFTHVYETIENDMAYERYLQAEKTLKGIITQDPLQMEAYLKLLELYVLTEKYQDFEQYYAKLPRDMSDIVPEIWSKIQLLKDRVENEKAIHLNVASAFKDDVETQDIHIEMAAHPLVPDLNPDLKPDVKPDIKQQKKWVGNDEPLEMVQKTKKLDLKTLSQKPASGEFLDLSKEYSLTLETPEIPQTPHTPAPEEVVPSKGSVSKESDMDILSEISLAEAHINMGNLEDAKELLLDIIAKGNAQQKQQAQQLLSRLEP